ncbi:MAG: glycosyltransferase family 9 protein [Chloroflexi bacterium]|nr:glycosyltransferase family 9 protein [Chloroflexota bacterium]
MKLLVAKLSDMGDVLTVTPALRALRHSLPQAHIALLTTPSGAQIVADSSLVDKVILFQKTAFDRLTVAFQPQVLAQAFKLARELRRQQFDTLAIMHHLTTCWGALKYAALAFASGAQRRVGLDNGRGWFLTQKVVDHGFGYYHEVEYWLAVARLLGASTEDLSLAFTLSPQDEAFARQLLSGIGDGLWVAIHPGGGGYSLARRWSLKGFAAIAQELIHRYQARIVIVGGPEERELASSLASAINPPPLNLAGMTTLKELGAVIKGCRLYIGNDSGVMHLAMAMGVPMVAIFGPSNPGAWGPWPNNKKVALVRSDLLCSPCLYVDGRIGNPRGCETPLCLNQITPELVVKAAESVLSQCSILRG